MGYLYNQLATVVSGIFAIVLVILWIFLGPTFPVLQFVFIMAIPIMIFLVITCWFSQKSADYSTSNPSHIMKNEEISLERYNNMITPPKRDKMLMEEELMEVKSEFGEEIKVLRSKADLKDDQIIALEKQIKELETQVQVEVVRTELIKLKQEVKKLS